VAWVLAYVFSAAGGRARDSQGRSRALSGPTQTWLKFGPRMNRAGHIGLIESHWWGAAQWSAIQSDQLRHAPRLTGGDALGKLHSVNKEAAVAAV
jgi:hypothetical protein